MDTELTNYKISSHCETRYAERIMGKDDKFDVSKFILDNKDKIKTDINKMITYGQLIYSGKSVNKSTKNNILDVYLNGCWIVLLDKNAEIVVTLYKVDLGLDDEFNKEYISKMLEKLNNAKETLALTRLNVLKELRMYNDMIVEAEEQIKEYKSMIKNLEELCIGYKNIIDNNDVKEKQANREVADIVNTLISKKEF